MKLNISHFKKVSENDHSAVLSHPNGHEIHIAKKSLSPKQHEDLKKLPVHMDEGGQVSEDEDDDSGRSPAGMTAAEAPPYGISTFFGSSAPSQSQPVQSAPQQPVPQQAAPSNIPLQMPKQQGGMSGLGPDPMGLGAEKKMLTQGMQGVEAGAGEQAAAIGKSAPLEAQMFQAHAEQLKNLQDISAKHFNDLWDEQNKILADYKNGHINPNQVWQDKSIPSKISTGIGILLSGIGSGLTGQQNMAMQFLNDQINRSIDAQKANFGIKNNLLTANFKMLGNMQDAEALTRANLNGILSDQISQVGAIQKGPLSDAAKKQLVGQLQMNLAPEFANIAQRRAMMQMLQGGMGGNADPSGKIMMLKQMGLIDQPTQDAAVKELGAAQNHAVQSQSVMDAFDTAAQENTLGNRVMHAGFTPASVARYQTAIMPYLKDAEGRINQSELERTDSLIPQPGDLPAKVTEKRQGLEQFLREKASFPTLQGLQRFGVSIPSVPPAVNKKVSPQNYKR